MVVTRPWIVEYARFGRLDGKARYRIFVSSRHHCQEISATYVLEGMLEQVFAADDLGRWLRENAEIRVVPFADKDTVSQSLFYLDDAADSNTRLAALEKESAMKGGGHKVCLGFSAR